MAIALKTKASTMVTFDQLWQFAKTVAAKTIAAESTAQPTKPTPASVFEPIGLRLEPPNKPWGYYCTPRNARTFASTGRDGVHYSFLEVEGLRHTPIVMTVPMSFELPNIVIAETLHEFLCLGCRAGYLSLESLTMEEGDLYPLTLNECVGEYVSCEYARSLSRSQRTLLWQLSQAFSLSPYVDVNMALVQRMAQLQTKYLDFLQMGEVASVPANVPTRSVVPAAFTFGQFLRH